MNIRRDVVVQNHGDAKNIEYPRKVVQTQETDEALADTVHQGIECYFVYPDEDI
jgi:hypothetical protein